MSNAKEMFRDALRLDAAAEVNRITAFIRQCISQDLRRQGGIVAMSGGIDSSVVAALAVRALGARRVLGLLLPEQESSGDSARLATLLARQLGIETITFNITPVLEAAGCYRDRNAAVQSLIPDFDPSGKFKIVLNPLDDGAAYRVFTVVAETADGREVRERATPQAYLGVVAATNFKQRVRKMTEYYHADRLNYAVLGTPNRLEYDQGFFVKLGDGAADLKPIAHLYKTQVYQLAEYLGLPEEIRMRPPTTDTYSLSQSQEEFYFSLPYAQMDICLYAKNHGIAAAEAAEATDLPVAVIERVFQDIDSKRRTTRYLHLKPQLAASVEEIAY